MSEWIDIPEIDNLKIKIEPDEPGFTVSRELSLKEFDKLKEVVYNRVNKNLKGNSPAIVKGYGVLPPDHPYKKSEEEFEHLAPDHPWRRGTIPVFKD